MLFWYSDELSRAEINTQIPRSMGMGARKTVQRMRRMSTVISSSE
jgi:hypothetical protein